MERQAFSDAPRPTAAEADFFDLPRSPMLSMIDEARGELVSPFAADRHAPQLELIALKLTEFHWSEMVWVTGDVPAGAFHRVCNELERFRLIFAQLASEQINTAA